LAIPPAWTDVWISLDPQGHIQAAGTDQAGRRQYIYHRMWRQRQDQQKFDRALLLASSLASSLAAARRTVTIDLGTDGFSQRRLLAAAFRIIDLGSLRVGSEEYLHANGSRGLTTLLCRHAVVTGIETTLTFPAKSGQKWISTIADTELGQLIASIKAERGPRSRLLAWRNTTWHPIHASHINEPTTLISWCT
jgi:DNA topoisomerase-1